MSSYAFKTEDAFRKFRKHLKGMRDAAMKSIPLPEDVLVEEVLKKTPYGFSERDVENIWVFKEKIGERAFQDLIWTLSTPIYINPGQRFARPLLAYQSWLLEITEQFIDLLKLTPDLPPVVTPLKQIAKSFLPELNTPRSNYSDESFRENCRTIIQNFMTRVVEDGFDSTSHVYKQIQKFLKNVVDILITFLERNQEQALREFIRQPGMNVDGLFGTRMGIQSTFDVNVLPNFERLYQFNKRRENAEFFKNIDLKKWMTYQQAERPFIMAELKKQHPEYYKNWRDYWKEDWDSEMISHGEEVDRQRAQGAAAKGGRKKMRSLRKTHSNKRRTHKKRK